MKKIFFCCVCFCALNIKAQSGTKQENVDWLNATFDKYLNKTVSNLPNGQYAHENCKVRFDSCKVKSDYSWARGSYHSSVDLDIKDYDTIKNDNKNPLNMKFVYEGYKSLSVSFDLTKEEGIVPRIHKTILYLRNNYCRSNTLYDDF